MDYQKLIVKKFQLALWLFVILSNYSLYAQNVGVSSSSSFTPDASAGLDVSYTNKGLLLPRVALTATNATSPISSPATSLLVYNTATAGTSPYNVVPGFYYYSGSTYGWVNLATNVSGNVTVAAVIKTASYTITLADYLVINTGTTAVTFTLPAANASSGHIFELLNHGTTAVTVSPAVTNGNGSTVNTIPATGTNIMRVVSDGTTWRRIN